MSATVISRTQGIPRQNAVLAGLRAAFAEKPEVACVILIAAGVDAAAAATGWWRLAGAAEPKFLLIFRAAALCLAVANLIAAFDLKHRPGLLHLSATIGIGGPLLLLLMFATVDGQDMAGALTQKEQCGRLMSSFAQTDFAAGTAWYTHRIVAPPVVARDDYTLTDGLEAAAFFTRKGFYFGFMGGLLSLLCLWGWNGAAARREVARTRRWLVLAGALLLIGDFGRLGIGFVYWNMARQDMALGDYQKADRDDQTAARWDPRSKYDLIDGYEKGRLDGALNRRTTPDYWAMVGDTWIVTGQGNPVQGYLTYLTHIPDPQASFEIKTRYANAAYRYGALVYPKTPQYALSIWKHGHSVDPQNLELIYALALGETQVRQYDDAIVYWRLLLSDVDGIGIFQNKFTASSTYLRPISAHAWAAMAWCYFNTRNYDAANRCAYNATLPGAIDPGTVASEQTDNGN